MIEYEEDATEATQDSDSSEQAPAAAGASDTSVEPVQTEAADSSEDSSSNDWNGELESLQTADWVRSLDESVRNNILSGIENKYKNWQRGYTEKFQETSAWKKQLETREEELRANEAKVQRWLYGDADPLGETRKEMQELKEQHEAAMEALKKDHEAALALKANASSEDYEKLIEERNQALKKLQSFEEDVRVQRERELDTAVDEFENWIRETAEDIYLDDDAFYSLCVLCTGGIDRDTALAMVRGKYKVPEPEPQVEPEPEIEPEQVPASVDLMNLGTGQARATGQGESRKFDDIMDALRREAQRGEF